MWNCQSSERPFSYELYPSISGIEAQWNEVLPDGHALKSPEMAAFESMNPPGLSFLYALIYFSDGSRGVAWFQVMEVETDFILSDSSLSRSAFQISKWLLGSKSRWLVCGHLFRMGFPGYYAEKEQNKSLILDLLLDLRRQQPFTKKMDAFVWKDAEPCSELSSEHLKKFNALDWDFSMKLKIQPTWKQWEDYLTALQKKYRQRARKIAARAESLTIRKLSATEVLAFSPILDALYLQVWQRQDAHFTRLPVGYFASQSQIMGDRFEIFGFFEDQKLIAFSSQIHQAGNELEVHYIGLNYTKNDEFALYFNILFLGIKTGIEQSKEWVDFGRTSLEAKANTGAEPLEMMHLVLFRKGLTRIGKNMLNHVKEKMAEKGITRNVFREEAEHAELH